jgi:hypothetical protein
MLLNFHVGGFTESYWAIEYSSILTQKTNYLINISLCIVRPYMDFSMHPINNPIYFVEISYERLPE